MEGEERSDKRARKIRRKRRRRKEINIIRMWKQTERRRKIQ
jgi:hypothetical protein